MIKIDVKKAFDSAAQTSMGHLVTEHIGKRGHPCTPPRWTFNSGAPASSSAKLTEYDREVQTLLWSFRPSWGTPS